jgi:hypothetical protein
VIVHPVLDDTFVRGATRRSYPTSDALGPETLTTARDRALPGECAIVNQRAIVDALPRVLGGAKNAALLPLR